MLRYIKKTRVGESIGQEQKLFYEEDRTENEKSDHFNGSKDHILIIDDFTNSGGTLFGAVKLFDDGFFLSRKLRLVKMYAGNAGSDEMNVSIFVSHLVATYDPKAAVRPLILI